MNRTVRIVVCAAIAVAALIAAAWFFLSGGDEPAIGGDASVRHGKEQSREIRHTDRRNAHLGKKIDDGSRGTVRRKNAKSAQADKKIIGNEGAEDPDEVLTEVEQKLSDDIQEALDDEKLETVLELCKKIDFSSKRELREQAVAALGWFDGKTMAELTPFLADPDEDIASDALFQWQEALHEIESEAVRASVVGQAMGILNDENALGQLAMELNSIDEKLAVDTLVQVIAGKNPAGVAAGKEAYEFITGEEFTTPEAANKWLQENYSPPD